MTKKGLAIITGASKGIGSVVSLGLANDGYRVVLIARNQDRIKNINEMIQPEDVLNTIRFLLNLSKNVSIREIILEMKNSII